jgi:hypothetical protein
VRAVTSQTSDSPGLARPRHRRSLSRRPISISSSVPVTVVRLFSCPAGEPQVSVAEVGAGSSAPGRPGALAAPSSAILASEWHLHRDARPGPGPAANLKRPWPGQRDEAVERPAARLGAGRHWARAACPGRAAERVQVQRATGTVWQCPGPVVSVELERQTPPGPEHSSCVVRVDRPSSARPVAAREESGISRTAMPGCAVLSGVERTGPTGGGPARVARRRRAGGGWERGADRATRTRSAETDESASMIGPAGG